MKKILWKIGGNAGFGIKTVGLSFSKIISALGYDVFNYTEYPSLVKGGLNTYEVVVSNRNNISLKENIDILACLNEKAFLESKERLSPNTRILFNSEDFVPEGDFVKIPIPITQILSESDASALFINMIFLGTSIALLKLKKDDLSFFIKEAFKKKGEDVISKNQEVAELGYDWINKNVKDEKKINLKQVVLPSNKNKKLVLTGNDAFSLGAVAADCRFYAAYPMTPASSVLSTLASWQEKTGIIVSHVEDEISAINNVIGASFAGVRSAVGTSGGGFALMAESISLSGMTESPVVIFLAQRVGPATGMPTWTEQADLLFSIFTGHGEFPRIILAPGDVEEMLELSAKAFNLADIYQTPVIVLSDKYLSESYQSLNKNKVLEFLKGFKIDRGKTIVRGKKGYLRYKYSPDGISPRLIPYKNSGIFYQANSYEHLENTHTTEDFNERIKQVKKRSLKMKTYLQDDFKMPNIYGDIESASVIFVSWGSTKLSILDGMDLVKTKIKTALVHFTHIFPLDKGIEKLFLKKGKYVLVENNSKGQLGKILRMELGIDIKTKLLKYDGRPFWPEEIAKFALKKI